MIGIFHSLPSLSELKRNYLFFEEIQTSESYINNILLRLSSYYPTGIECEGISNFRRQIDYLFESGIIRNNDSFQEFVLPINELSENEIIHQYRSSNGIASSVTIRQQLADFYRNIQHLKNKFGVEIEGYSTTDLRWIVSTSMSGTLNKDPNIGGIAEFLSRKWVSSFELIEFVNLYSNLYSRYAAVSLNSQTEDKYFTPIIYQSGRTSVTKDFAPKWPAGQNLFSERRSRIAEMVIDKLPIPDDTTSWEKLVDFKNDPQALASSIALRVWINEMAGSNLKMFEIHDKLDYLAHIYKTQLERHKIKYRSDVFESIVVPTLEFIENMARFKPSQAVKSFVGIKQKAYEAMAEELKLEGKEIAFIQKANAAFGGERHQ